MHLIRRITKRTTKFGQQKNRGKFLYPAVMIKAVNTFIADSTMFTILEHLDWSQIWIRTLEKLRTGSRLLIHKVKNEGITCYFSNERYILWIKTSITLKIYPIRQSNQTSEKASWFMCFYYAPQLHTNCNRTCLLHSFVERIPHLNPSNCRYKHMERNKPTENKTNALVMHFSSRYQLLRLWSQHLFQMNLHPEVFLHILHHQHHVAMKSILHPV